MDNTSLNMNEVKKVKFKMILWFTSFFTIIVIILSYLIIRRTNLLWREKVMQLETALNNECNKNLNTLITQVETASNYMEVLTEEANRNFKENKYSPDEKQIVVAQLTNFFANFSAIRTYDDLTIIYDDGTFVGSIKPLDEKNFNALTLYENLDKAIQNNNYEKNWFSGLQNNFDRIYYVKRIYSNAIFMCSINPSKIEEFVINTKSIPGLQSIKTILINNQNQIIYSPDNDEMGTTVPHDAIDKMLNNTHIYEGKYFSLSHCTNGWRLINSTAVKELLSERRFIITYVLILATVAISIILIFCIVFSLQLTIPIENLINTLHNQATRDRSTRFYNKNTFTELCNKTLEERPQNKLAFFYIDIDHFNYLIEYFGYDEAEKIIVEVADSLRHVFPKSTLFGRLGTDRIVLMTEIKDEENIISIINNYCTNFQQQLFGRFQDDYDVTASVGVSIYPNQEKRYPLLLKFAEKAMAIVKKDGRNGFHIFDPENDLKVQE